MTDILVKGLTGTPAEVTLFTDANIVNHAAILSGTLLNIAYTKTISNVSSLYFTNRDKSLLGSWPAAGTHAQIPTTYTPTDYAPFVCKPSVLTIGNTVHVLWAYFIKQDGYISTVEIGTGYAGGTLGIESYVSYNGLTYINPTNVLLQSAIDSDAEVDALIAGIPGVNPGEWLVEPQLVEVTIAAAAPKGTHHTVNNMVVEYFFSADAGVTWLSEVVIDKVANTNMIYTGTDFVFNTSASDDSGMLYLAISGYNDTTSDNTDYDNFLQVIKGNLNSWSYAKKYSVFNTQGSSAIDAPSLLTYNTNDIDFMLTCVKESASINSNHNLDLMIPDYDNDAPQKYMCINKSIASTFEFPPTEDVEQPLPPDPLTSLTGVIRNGYEDKPFGNIAVTSTGDIWSSHIHTSGIYNNPATTIYAPSEFTTIGTAHAAIWHSQIVKSGAVAPYVWYKVKKRNTSQTRPLVAAFAINSLQSAPALAAAITAGELLVVTEAEIFPNLGSYSSLSLYTPEGVLIKEIDPHSLPTFASRGSNYSKVIHDFVIDKNDNLWLSYGYYDYNPAPTHWNLCKYETETDTITPIYYAASDSHLKQYGEWAIVNTATSIETASLTPVYRTVNGETVLSLINRIKADVEYHTGLVLTSTPTSITLPAGYTWARAFEHVPTGGEFNSNYIEFVNSTLSGANLTLNISSLGGTVASPIGDWFFHNTQSAKLSVSTDGKWVSFHGFVTNRLGSSDIVVFDVDTTLPTAPTGYAPHVRIPWLQSYADDMNVTAVHIDKFNVLWAFCTIRGGLDITAPLTYQTIYRFPLPTANSSSTQYIIQGTGESLYTNITTNNMSVYGKSTVSDYDKAITNISGRVSLTYGHAPGLVSDDEFLYVIFNDGGSLLGVNIYYLSGEFYKRAVLRSPSAYLNMYSYSSADLQQPGAGVHQQLNNTASLGRPEFSACESTLDAAGTIVYNGTYQFNTAELLKDSGLRVLSFHHSYTAGNVNSNAEFTVKIASSGTQRYVYAGSDYATATATAKILEVDINAPGVQYNTAVYQNTVMIVEMISGTFIKGDLIKESTGTSDTGVHASLLSNPTQYIKLDAKLLDAYSPHICYSAQEGMLDKSRGQAHKNDKLYISTNTKEIKIYSAPVPATADIIISNPCTATGSIVLLLDSKVSGGNGCSISFTRSGLNLSDPHPNLPGRDYKIGDILYLGSTSDYATFNVTAVNASGGVTALSMSSDTSMTLNLLTADTTQNSFYAKNFCAVTCPLTLGTGSDTNSEVAALIATQLNASNYVTAVAVGNTVSVTYKILDCQYDSPVVLSNSTGVSLSTSFNRSKTKYPALSSSANVLHVSHTLTENYASKVFNRIKDAIEYAETNGTSGAWYTVLVYPGTWYEEINPNPTGTTQLCNYIIKAVTEDAQYDSSLRTSIRGYRNHIYNMSVTKTAQVTSVTLAKHSMKNPDTITITYSSNTAAIPLGTRTVTRTSADTFTFDTTTATNIGSNTTIAYTIDYAVPVPRHGRGLIELKESGVANSTRMMVLEGFVINNGYVPVLTTQNETGARYLFKRLHQSAVSSNEVIIFNKCTIYNTWSEITAPGDANDTHYFNSRGYGYIQNSACTGADTNNFTAVYYNCIAGRANQNHSPTFYTNDLGYLSDNDTISIYTIGSCFNSGHAGGNYAINYTHTQKAIANNSGSSVYSIGHATNNTTAITEQPIEDVIGHTNILAHTGGVDSILSKGFYYLESTFWFDDAGNIQPTIPSDVFASMANRRWSPR